MVIYVWLLSFGILRCIQDAVCIYAFVAKYSSSVWLLHVLFIYQLADGNLHSFHFLAIILNSS